MVVRKNVAVKVPGFVERAERVLSLAIVGATTTVTLVALTLPSVVDDAVVPVAVPDQIIVPDLFKPWKERV